MRRAAIRDRFSPWAGMVLGTLGAGLAHQLGASWTFSNCRGGAPLAVIVGAVIGLALTGAGAFESWRAFNGTQQRGAVRSISAISLMSTPVFALAIVLPVIAAFVIPGCWR